MSYKNSKNSNARTQKSTEDSELIFGKVPPAAKELEEAVLGAIMLEKEALDTVSSILSPESFYVDAHQHIYTAILELSKAADPIDLLTVIEQLRKMEKLEAAGGPYYITRLTNSVVSSANILTHARIVHEKHILRQQIRLYSEGIHECYQSSSDAFEVLDRMNGKLTSLAMNGIKNEVCRVGGIAEERLMRLEILRHRDEGYTGVPSGFHDIDLITGGWQDTDLIILAARPSVGKTAFALNCARNASQHPTKQTPTLFFSLEMSKEQLTDRLLSAESGIELDVLTKAKATDAQMKQLYNNGVRKLEQYPLFIDDSGSLTIMDIRAKARKWKNAENIGLIVLDYLQLMSGSGDRNSNREQEISSISRGLKQLAKELKVPIIALSQLSRESEKQKREPFLSDLRESGAIEQDADMVAFLFREDYQKMEGEMDPMLRGISYIKISKHRNGALEKIPMYTDLAIQRWMTPSQWRSYQNNLAGIKPLKVVNGNYELDSNNPF